jgi:hypothetical protein
VNYDDLARGKLLFEAAVLHLFQGAPTRSIPFSREHPMPPGWEGVMRDCTWSEHQDRRFTNWGEQCDVCNYWGPSLEKLGDATTSVWMCLNCKLEKEYLDDLEDKNPQDPLGLGLISTFPSMPKFCVISSESWRVNSMYDSLQQILYDPRQM